MTMTMTLADEITMHLDRLNHLEMKADADDEMISLLKEQNAQQAAELTEINHKHDLEMQRLRQERDVAVRRAKEVQTIIDSLGRLAIDGLRKIRGDETPPVIPERPMSTTQHLQTVSKRLPPIKPEHEALLPRPSLAS